MKTEFVGFLQVIEGLKKEKKTAEETNTPVVTAVYKKDKCEKDKCTKVLRLRVAHDLIKDYSPMMEVKEISK